MITKVRLRENNEMIDINITGETKPLTLGDLLEKWQKIIDIVADIIDVPAGLIMKITKDNMEVFLSSQTQDNPFEYSQ